MSNIKSLFKYTIKQLRTIAKKPKQSIDCKLIYVDSKASTKLS